jgi:hypothetical protein
MTNDEFATFAKRLFAAFPDLWEWIKKSPDVMGTQAAWRETLRPCRLDECLFVLGEWISGAIDAPKAYERGHTALLLKSRVMRIRDDEAAKRRSSNHGEAYAAAKKKRYEPLSEHLPGLEQLYIKVLPINEMEKAGRIDMNERQRMIEDLMREAGM